MKYEDIKYEQEGHLVTITINRPDRMNSCTEQTNNELIDAWHTFRADDAAWCAILTGEGDDWFSAGIDMQWLLEHFMSGEPYRKPEPREGIGGLTHEFECWKPLIAAINGNAGHAGFDMAMACDMIVASEDAKFILSAPKVAGATDRHGLIRLSRQLPLKIAMGTLLTGSEITAQEGERWGLVNEVVPKGEVMAAARRWADRVLQCAPLALSGTKEWAMRQFDLPYTAALTHKYFSWDEMRNSEDSREGLRAYAKGEKYEYKGQ